MTQLTSDPNRAPTLLRSSRLTVEIAAPGTVYRGARFDWNGFITQVTLDGKHTFCVPESFTPGKGTGGIGMCNEFTHENLMGYAEAKVGETFPKLGIGLLKRQDDGPFNVFHPQEIAVRFPFSLSRTADQAHFVVEPLDCRGYSVREEKTLRVEENQLYITYQIGNTGSQPVLVNEYVHNFIGIDSQPIGPDYVLSLPYAVELDSATRFMEPDVLIVKGQAITFNRTPTRDFYCRPQGAFPTEQAQWELRLLSSKVGMREFDDFPPKAVAVWGVAHVISAEIFVEIKLQPGEKQTWTRRFEFFD